MAAQEIITLLEGTPQLMAPQTGNSYSAPRTMTITPETNTGALILTGGSVTASNPLISATQTWNAGAVAFSGIKVNITDTASLATSTLADFQIAGVSVNNIRKSGVMSFPGSMSDNFAGPGIGNWFGNLAIFTNAGVTITFGSTVNYTSTLGQTWNSDTGLYRVAAGILKIGDATGANGGALRLGPVAVASLPAAATAGNGCRAHVTDALAPTFGATVAAGGAVSVPVYSDGSAWKVG